MRQAEYQDGQYWDVLLMSVLSTEWRSNARKGGELNDIVEIST
jgi:hypothetical protein